MGEEKNTNEVADPQAIIVGIDGSKASRNALGWAIKEAQAQKLSIRLVGAYTVPYISAPTIDVSYVPIDDSGVRAAVTESLKDAAEEVKAGGVEVEAIIEIGDAAGVLVEESKQGSLAVVGSRGRGGFAGRLLGTVSSALPAHAHCPTVVVPVGWAADERRVPEQSASRPIRNAAGDSFESTEAEDTVEGPDYTGKVVVGIDALGKESQALWEAAKMAQRRGSTLVILGVITTTVVGPEWLPSTGDMKRYIDQGADKLATAAAAVREEYPDLDVSWTLYDGQPAEALVRASDTASVLVIGSRGRGGFAGLLLGSTSQSVLPYSKCPTMVVRVGRDQQFM